MQPCTNRHPMKSTGLMQPHQATMTVDEADAADDADAADQNYGHHGLMQPRSATILTFCEKKGRHDATKGVTLRQ